MGVSAAPVGASRGQTLTFEAPSDLLDAHARPAALTKLQSLGVHSLRLVLYWQDVAPQANSATAPKVDLTDPASYSWGEYDPVIAAAAQRHWSVLLTVSGPVPRWATASRKDHVTRPDPLSFQRFMTAVGRHYGSRVSLFAIWNEPNHPFFLMPQFDARHQPASPRIYRALFQAGYAGLRAAGLAHPRVLMGETAPTGTDTGAGKHDVAPLAFLRGALCLNSRYQKASSCSQLPAYGYAHHAYTSNAGPYYVSPITDDVQLGTLSRLTRALDLAARAHAIRAHMSVYLTEFGWQSKPNLYGLPVSTQAEFDALSERIAYLNPRVASFSQYLLRDDRIGGPPGSSVHGGYVGFQTGLEYLNGRPKPLYNGFRLPLVVLRQGSRLALWGLVRPARAVTHVQVLVRNRGSRRFSVLARSVATSATGYWTLHSGDLAAQQLEVRWRSPGGVLYTGAPIAPYRR